MLHLITQPLAQRPVLARIVSGDAVLFLENAVYDLRRHGAFAAALSELGARAKLYALAPDLRLRGIPPASLVPGITCIEDTGFVELTLRHRTSKTWR